MLNTILNVDKECNFTNQHVTDENMTKLLEWLLGLGLFTCVWASLLTANLRWHVDDFWKIFVLPLPFILVILFGVYSLFVVLWRVYTFNDCSDAAEELQKQIKEAKVDLEKKGFKFAVR